MNGGRMTKLEFNAAVAAGCVAGFMAACGLWAAALGVAAINRAAPGLGWAIAGLLVAGLAAAARSIWIAGNQKGE